MKRDEHFLNGIEAVLRGFEYGVSESVSASVGVERGLHRLPAGIPDAASILYIVVMAAAVHRTVIVAVTREPHELCVLIEAVAARCI